MTSNAELWNGGFAMLGLVALAFTEYVKGGTLTLVSNVLTWANLCKRIYSFYVIRKANHVIHFSEKLNFKFIKG